ncbi:hypothetical protein YQE_08720, partial [Dendroctonus ponderosae]
MDSSTHLTTPKLSITQAHPMHIAKRDPLYDTNTLSPDADPGQELTSGNHVSDPVDRGGHGDTIYIPHKPFIKIVEKPVYIKEPEPIIEIIIKESNITLPAPPTEAPPPPQKKKKEEVQVFYVKYKKNPNGYGKDSVIYDKPIPAIAPVVPEETEPEEEWKDTPQSGYGAYSNEVTEAPKPSTTLRTIIKPDSEVYHSPGNNVKVTFGKEGFDYDKRSSKPEDYPGPQIRPQEDQPRAPRRNTEPKFEHHSHIDHLITIRNHLTNITVGLLTENLTVGLLRHSFPRLTSSYPEVNSQFKIVEQPRPEQHNLQYQNVHHQQQQQQQQQHQQHQQQQVQQHQIQHSQQSSNEQTQYQEHLNNLRSAQDVLPPGGELLQSLPKFEQHLIVDPTTGQLSEASSLEGSEHNYQQQASFAVSSRQNDEGLNRAHKQVKSQTGQNPQQYLQTSHSQNGIPNQSSGPVYTNQRSAEKSAVRSYSTTTVKPTTTTQEPEKPSTTTKDPKILEAQLPDEVPEDLRQQLLSSGILNNADISILDYDKVGDIPLSALPPDQLANFYGAGGAQQIAAAGSEQVPQVAALTARRDSASTSQDQEMSAEESEISEVAVAPAETNVEMKVVKYNPETDKGQKVQEAYISDAAKQVEPVVLNDNSYNRYLPLKVNGTQFPIPDVPELKGKRISSVVVLAPISYDFSSRKTREASPDNDLQFIQNGPLKELLANPTQDNYKKFLDSEKNTAVSKQAVILLVTK